MTTTDFTVRMDFGAHAPRFSKLLGALDTAAREGDLDRPLMELVRMHASQLNGCAYCVDMHTKDARHDGETEQRLYALPVWRETPFFSSRERAALELTEAMTRLAEAPVSDETFARVSEHFTDVELAELIWCVTVINAWNRLGATARPWPLS